jgi:hypothetical protein
MRIGLARVGLATLVVLGLVMGLAGPTGPAYAQANGVHCPDGSHPPCHKWRLPVEREWWDDGSGPLQLHAPAAGRGGEHHRCRLCPREPVARGANTRPSGAHYLTWAKQLRRSSGLGGG